MGRNRKMDEKGGGDGLDDSLLDAYIDGELEDGPRRQVEQWLQRDPAAADYVRRVRRLQDLSRRQLQEIDQRPLPDELDRMLERLRQSGTGDGPGNEGQRGLAWARPLLATAASLLILFVGYAVGVMTTEGRFEKRLVAVEQAREASLSEIRAALNRALEYNPSGSPVNWESKRYNASAELLPIRTLKAGDNQYCREYREILIIDGTREERRGLSCRLGKERWQTRLIMPEKGKELF